MPAYQYLDILCAQQQHGAISTPRKILGCCGAVVLLWLTDLWLNHILLHLSVLEQGFLAERVFEERWRLSQYREPDCEYCKHYRCATGVYSV